MNQSRHALIALSFAILTAGFLASEAAVVLPLLLSSLSLTAGQGGWIISVRFLGGTLASIMLLVLGLKISFRTIILSSSVVVFVTALLLPFVRTYVPVLIYSFVRGLALTLLIAATNAALSSWFWKNAGRWAAYVHIWFGVGLIAAPVAGFMVVAIGLPWQVVWALAGVLSIIVLLLALSLPRSRTPRGAVPELRSGGSSPGRIPKSLWLLPLAIAVVDVGTEGSIIGWVPSYVVLNGGSGAAGQTASLLLALGIILGRASVSRLSRRVETPVLYRGSLLAVAMSALLMLLIPVARPFAAPVLGLGMSAMYPTMVALFGRRARLTHGRLYAGTELAGTLGGTAIPALVGTLSESAPAIAFPTVLMAGVSVLFLLSTVFRRQEYRHSTPDGR